MTTKTIISMTAMMFCLTFISCKDDDSSVNPVPPDPKTTGIIVVNEGGFGQNNATLTYYVPDSSKTYSNAYAAANNNNKLGDNANSMVIFGDLAYIAVDNSNKIEIINKNTFVSQGSVDLKASGSPREIYIKNANEGYVTSLYTGTVIKFNPTTKTEVKRIAVGENPEGIAESNGKIYVANSGNWPVYGNTVSIISAAADTVIGTLVVGRNPRIILKDSEHNIYIVCTGQYAPNDPVGRGGIYKISSLTGKVVDSLIINSNPGEACFAGNDIYIVNSAGLLKAGFTSHTVSSTPVITGSKVNPVSSVISSVAFDSQSQFLYLGNPKNFIQDGEVAAFSLTGEEKFRFSTGVNPGSIILKK